MKKGVYTATKKDGTLYYRSSITFQNKHISLGSFSSEKQAATAYLEAEKLLRTHVLTLDRFEENCTLSFAKWVCLLNFRDNGMYIKTPICREQFLVPCTIIIPNKLPGVYKNPISLPLFVSSRSSPLRQLP